MGPIDVPVDTDVFAQSDAVMPPERAFRHDHRVRECDMQTAPKNSLEKPLERAREMRLWRKWGVNHRFC